MKEAWRDAAGTEGHKQKVVEMSRGGKRSKRSKERKGPTIPNNRMLKRKHPFTDLSDRVCQTFGCRRFIKTRLVLLKDVDTCYHCWAAAERVRRKVRA